jgi:transposase
MEKLKVQQVQEIVHRLRRKQPERAICRDLGCSRETVRRYGRLARARGFLSESSPLPSLADLEAASAPLFVPRRSNVSSVEPYRSVVEDLLDKEVECTAIHRRLCRSHGYTGSYGSVLRFVHSIRPSVPEAVVRIETGVGKQAQVDFGTVGKMWDPIKKAHRTAYCFVMTLSWSRHMFVCFVFDQRIPTWLECHRLAFESFGGVPEEIVVDNLKAAVLQASLEDPVLSEPYSRFARHYSFLVHPCRPRTPEHKGKVESAVHYVKRNFVASEEIIDGSRAGAPSQCIDVHDVNKKVAAWVSEEAGLRIHGTTAARPMERFLGTEQAALLPLPTMPCDLEQVVRATLHRDCHVNVSGCFYSAPFNLIGRELDVHLHHQIVQIFDGTTLVTTHERAACKGQRITRVEHYPPEKTLYLTRTRSWCRERASRIGPICREVVDQMLDDGPLDRLRAIQGIMGLADRYPSSRVEAACARALHFGDTSCRRIKTILKAGTDLTPLEKTVQLKLVSFAFARGAEEFFEEGEMKC